LCVDPAVDQRPLQIVVFKSDEKSGVGTPRGAVLGERGIKWHQLVLNQSESLERCSGPLDMILKAVVFVKRDLPMEAGEQPRQPSNEEENGW